MQSSIMSVFRLPLNLLVVIGTKLTNNANDKGALQVVFAVLASMHLVAALLQGLLLFSIRKKDFSKQKKIRID